MTRKVVALMGLLGMLGLGSATAHQKSDTPKGGEVCLLRVSGMVCGACAGQVEKAAKKIDGVKAAKASQPKGTAEISYDPAKTTPEAIAKTITEKTGFQAEVSGKDRKE